MPVVNPETGEPVSDDPEQDDENLAGGEGRGEHVAATDTGKHSSVTSGPNNQREAEPGATQGDDGNALSGPNASGSGG